MPRLSSTHTRSTPPIVNVLVMPSSRRSVQHSAQSTPEVRINKLPGALPPEVRVIQFIVTVQSVQVRGQLGGVRELVHVDVRPLRGAALVVLRPRAHDHGQHVLRQPVHVELLRDVVAAVGVLEREVELVLAVQDLEALPVGARALERAAGAVDVHGDVLGQLAGVAEAAVAGAAVRYEPGDFFGFVGGVVAGLLLLSDLKQRFFCIYIIPLQAFVS